MMTKKNVKVKEENWAMRKEQKSSKEENEERAENTKRKEKLTQRITRRLK
jgi:hypothetical protein